MSCKDVDFNPLKGKIDEIDFQALVKDEVVHSVAEIVLENIEAVTTGVLPGAGPLHHQRRTA